jgi:Trehalose utilisation
MHLADNCWNARLISNDDSFRHESIPTAISALQSQTSKYNVLFDATEDNTFFTQSNLSNYDAILFLSTTDSNATARVEVLNTDEKVRTSI